nr:hypothetical protein [uncultured bacterium]
MINQKISHTPHDFLMSFLLIIIHFFNYEKATTKFLAHLEYEFWFPWDSVRLCLAGWFYVTNISNIGGF